MTTRFVDHLLTGVHGSRPAANAVPQGTLYACSTHGLVYQSDGSSTWATWATLGGTGLTVAEIDGAPSGTPSTLQFPNGTVTDEGSGVYRYTPAGGTTPNRAAFAYKAAGLEPLAIEALRTLSGGASYAIAGGATKLLLSAWNVQIGAASGKFDMRERDPLPLRGAISIYGPADGASGSAGQFAIIDPALATYADAETAYYDRLETIFTTKPLVVPILAAGTIYPLLPGPYGSIITGFTCFNLAWLALNNRIADLPFHDEISDAAGGSFRLGRTLTFPISKAILSGIESAAGSSSTGGSPLGSVLYFNCPSTWGAVADPNTYAFRDDFMGASLDTSTVWTRAQSSAGNVEIQSAAGVANWCKLLGDGTWAHNGAYSQASIARAAGKVFGCDLVISEDAAGSGLYANLVVGFSDGAGQSYSNFAHGLDFTGSGTSTRQIVAFENGNSRGVVGAGYTIGAIYRVRITIQATTSHAKYEIQGGPEYAALGGSTWTDITPGTTSSTTTPLHAGATVQSAYKSYVSDVRVY